MAGNTPELFPCCQQDREERMSCRRWAGLGMLGWDQQLRLLLLLESAAPSTPCRQLPQQLQFCSLCMPGNTLSLEQLQLGMLC